MIVLQDLLELRREMSDTVGMAQMEELGFSLGDPGRILEEIDSAITAMREKIRPALLKRFERVAAKYQRPLAPVRNGTCYGCFTRFPTGTDAPGTRDSLSVCPNCGRLVYEI